MQRLVQLIVHELKPYLLKDELSWDGYTSVKANTVRSGQLMVVVLSTCHKPWPQRQGLTFLILAASGLSHCSLSVSSIYEQVADAANDAAFEAAVSEVADWAGNNGFENISDITFAQQDSFMKQLLRQWVLYRRACTDCLKCQSNMLVIQVKYCKLGKLRLRKRAAPLLSLQLAFCTRSWRPD